MGQSVKMRQEVERKIVAAAIDGLLAAGFTLGVDNGENDAMMRRGGYDYEYVGTDKEACLKAMFQCDEDRLYVFVGDSKQPNGWVYFVYGNDGHDVISDYTTNLTVSLQDAMKLADHYGN